MENPESPYYMGNCELPPLVFETEYRGKTITLELHWDAGGDEFAHALYTCCSAYFGSNDTIDMMESFVGNSSEESEARKVLLWSDFRLTIKNNDRVFTVVLRAKQSSRYDIMQAFYAACISNTYDEKSVYEMIDDYLVGELGRASKLEIETEESDEREE